MLNVSNTSHEYHIGTTELRYAENSQTYQISLKLFTDDLESAIIKNSGNSQYLGSPQENIQADSLIFNYVEKHFSLENAEGKRLSLVEIGRETELNDTWIYLESQKMEPLKELRVSNDIFMELNQDQVHIVNLIQNGVTKSTRLNKSAPSALLKI